MSALKLSDLKVGDKLRNVQNQGLWEVTEVKPMLVKIKALGTSVTQSSFVNLSNLHTFRQVDDSTGQVSQAHTMKETVRDYYEVDKRMEGALDFLAERDDTPEAKAEALSKGFKSPYWVSMRGLVVGNLDTVVLTLHAKQRDAIKKALNMVEEKVRKGTDHDFVTFYESLPATTPSTSGRAPSTAPVASPKPGEAQASTAPAKRRREPRWHEG